MRTPRLVGAAAASVAALALTAAPAQADGIDGLTYEPDPVPTVAYPLPRGAEVQLEAPPHAWGVRRLAQFYDRTLGVTIYRHGTCAERPWALCIRMEFEDYGPHEHLGRVHYYDGSNGTDANPILIQINTYGAYGPDETGWSLAPVFKEWAPRHELTHALGMRHHRLFDNCIMNDSVPWPCPEEVDALVAYYGGE